MEILAIIQINLTSFLSWKNMIVSWVRFLLNFVLCFSKERSNGKEILCKYKYPLTSLLLS